ncbi:MAG: nickel pincer cofactor biosynthesis protein LarC [Blastocatellia bacterium]|nr:nickel pincer cofactor biosynthesis protein LarC [Blastocatellia bacterium]
MARTLYLDCFAGASGDMLIGALLDCGLDFDLLKSNLKGLGVEGYELRLATVDRCGITAAKFDVVLGDEPDEPHDHGHQHAHDHAHPHDHSHHDHAPVEPHLHAGHRALSTIRRMIADAALSPGVKARAQTIFQRIGEAESKIHNIPIETVHFHEVGAVDSIVDIVGCCIGLEALGIERVISSPLHVGFGTFRCAHGIYPVPGPATTELLKGAPIYSKDIEGELMTPTGAAIISTLAESYGHMPMMRIERIGYGAGTRTYPKFPNVLRAILGETQTDADETPDLVTVIEANLDDLNPQVFGHVMEQALAAGALDLFYTAVQMKKNRPGVLLTLLCRPADRPRMIDLLLRETTTLGVRHREERREILRREFLTVETPYGPIRLKLAKSRDGQTMNAAPEFEDCRAAALRHQVPLREVQMAAMRRYSGKTMSSGEIET